MKKAKKIIPNILVALILITGIGFLTYPTISDLLNELHSSKAIASYVERSKDMSKEEKERLLTEAKEYNQSLVHRNNRYSLSKDELSRYEQIMDVTDTGIMGYIEIPKINVYMPIYHNVDEGSSRWQKHSQSFVRSYRSAICEAIHKHRSAKGRRYVFHTCI